LDRTRSGLSEVVLGGDGLEGLVGQEGVKRNDSGGVAGESAGGEGINLVDGGAHGSILAEAEPGFIPGVTKLPVRLSRSPCCLKPRARAWKNSGSNRPYSSKRRLEGRIIDRNTNLMTVLYDLPTVFMGEVRLQERPANPLSGFLN
jgi:hypothetical protein